MKIQHMGYRIKGNFDGRNNFTCMYALLKIFGPLGLINGRFEGGFGNYYCQNKQKINFMENKSFILLLN